MVFILVFFLQAMGQTSVFYSNDMELEAPFDQGSQSLALAHSGSYSELLSVSSDFHSVLQFNESGLMPVLPAGDSISSFEYKVWINDVDNQTQTYRLYLRFGYNDGSWHESDFDASDVINIGSGWQEVSYDFASVVNSRMSEGYTHITRITLRKYENSGVLADFYTDDISLVYETAGQVLDPPQITQQPHSQSKVVGETATFKIMASGTSPLSYQWYRNDSIVNGAVDSSYTTEMLEASDDGDLFYCIVSNSAGNATSSSVNLLVSPAIIWYSNNMESEAPFDQGSQSSVLAHTGSFSELLSVSSDFHTVIQFNESGLLPVLPSGDSISSFEYKVWLNDVDNQTQTYRLYLRFGYNDGSWHESDFDASDVVGIGSGWQEISHDFAAVVNSRISEGYTHITRITLRKYENSGVLSDFYADDISLVYETAGQVLDPPQITDQPQSQSKVVGETATFTITASGTAPLSYQWYRNASMVSGAVDSSYTTEILEASDDGDQFSCVVSNADGNVSSSPAILSVLPGSGSGDDLVLVSNGVAQYKIYYGPGESAIVEHAALELGMQLDKITGSEMLVTNNDSSTENLIIVGRNNPFVSGISSQFDSSFIKDDGFRLLAHNNNLILAGAVDRGTLYACYYLLDYYFGLHWLDPLFEVVPSTSTLSVSASLNDLQNPRFMYREIFSDSDNEYIRQHNLLNGSRFHRSELEYEAGVDTWSEDGPVGAHNFVDVAASYESGGQILTMSSDARTTAATHFVNEIASKGDGPWYGFSQEDNAWSPDAASQAFADAHGGALSAPILDMLTEVTGKVRETYPDAHLSTLAYQWSFPPPTGMTVPEYVMVETAPIEANFGYSYNDSANLDFDYDQWNNVAATLGIWDYQANFQNYLQPLPNIYPMCKNIQYFGNSVPAMKSYFGQGSFGVLGGEFAELRRWIAARLLWNPVQDYMSLISQFCDEYYGAASSYIKDYIALMHQSFEDSNGKIAAKTPITADYLDLDFILQADQLMTSADAAVSGDYAKHVHKVRLGVDMTILLRGHLDEFEAQEDSINWVEDPNRRTRFDQYAAEAGITGYNEGSDLSLLQAAMDVDRVYPPVPDFVQEGDEWIDLQDLDYTICCGATIVEDTLASDHGAVQKGEDGAWAIQIPLDLLPVEGEWDVYAYIRAEGASGTSFDMGPYPEMSVLSVSESEVQDGAYHWYEFPGGTFHYETGRVFFIARSSGTIYLDRIVAVRTDNALQSNSLDHQVSGVNTNSSFEHILGDNFPNPFSDVTRIPYTLSAAANVCITVFDVTGQLVAALLNERQEAGYKEIIFDAQKLSSGVYFYRISVDGFDKTKKMILQN